MQDSKRDLSMLKRPNILITAARIASQTYRRSRDLSAVLGYTYPTSDRLIRQRLFDLEYTINQKRRLDDASYDLKIHVQVLSALLAEVTVEL